MSCFLSACQIQPLRSSFLEQDSAQLGPVSSTSSGIAPSSPILTSQNYPESAYNNTGGPQSTQVFYNNSTPAVSANEELLDQEKHIPGILQTQLRAHLELPW